MEDLVLLFLNSWRVVGASGVVYGGVRGSIHLAQGRYPDGGSDSECVLLTQKQLNESFSLGRCTALIN